MSDRADYEYPEQVSYEIYENQVEGYSDVANAINRLGYDLLSVQHEYGIFGGTSGSHLMHLVREVSMPIVTTLHTVLSDPSPSQKEVLDELLQLSERVIVMSNKAVGYLVDVHEVCPEKIDLIPHGIPNIPDASDSNFRESLQIDGPMILTFGLLSPDKGIQYVIQAMPEIIAAHPGATYVILGATHPNIRASAGESYRRSLEALVEDLGIQENVRFVDRFVELQELVQYLAAMDIYVTPYLNPKQITSGTLAYSVGAGKAVISTPYAYAEELLADGRGLLVPFRDPSAIAASVLHIQSDEATTKEMGKRAADYGKNMLWPSVARQYLDSFKRAKHESVERLRSLISNPPIDKQDKLGLPVMRLNHLSDLSDDTGILQHATFTVPNRTEGYCVDDNARALLFTAYLESEKTLSPDVSLLQSRYLCFVMDALNPKTGRFRNFMSYNRSWLEESGSEDSHGRAMWSLGAMVSRSRDPGRSDAARSLFHLGIEALNPTTSPRTWAYGILAASEYLDRHPAEDSVRTLIADLSDRLWKAYQYNQGADWSWYEQSLTYVNARLPQALILAGKHLRNDDLMQIGLKSLRWLMTLQMDERGYFSPIGTNGFLHRGKPGTLFDQQPVEAAASISACLTALAASGDPLWETEAIRGFKWFLGENTLHLSMYDSATGGCHDGLHFDRINRNQGAESTLSFLCALGELKNSNISINQGSNNETYELK